MKKKARLVLWLCAPELVLLALAIIATLVITLLPNSSYFWGALARSVTLAGTIIALALPLVALHSGRAAVLGCWWCCCAQRNASARKNSRASVQEDSESNLAEGRATGKADPTSRWVTTTLVIDAFVVFFVVIAAGCASFATYGSCVRPALYQSRECERDCDKLLNVQNATALAARLPASFSFGVSSSAYQIEGGLEQSNWRLFEDEHANEAEYVHAGRACDGWRRFDEDLKLLQDLHVRSYRLSISWSRVHLAEGDHFDDAALARYREWMVKLRAAGIQPLVGLLHYEEPQWITRQGSWVNSSTTDQWLRFVEHVARNLSDVVDVYLTENESFVFATLGYLTGTWAPGIHTDLAVWWGALINLVDAHQRAYALLHRLDKVDADGDGSPCEVGLATFLLSINVGSHWNLVDPFFAGCWGLVMNKFFPAAADLANHADFIGINTYAHVTTSMFTFGPPRSWLEKQWNVPSWLFAIEWREDASALFAGICEASQLTGGLPVRITEHGTAEKDQQDFKRQLRLQQAVEAVSAAEAEGLIVHSYNHWSFLDSYEWSSGYGPKFGLYAVNFSSDGLERIPRGSATLFSKLAGAHSDALGADAYSHPLVRARASNADSAAPHTKQLRLLANQFNTTADSASAGRPCRAGDAQARKRDALGPDASLVPAC